MGGDRLLLDRVQQLRPQLAPERRDQVGRALDAPLPLLVATDVDHLACTRQDRRRPPPRVSMGFFARRELTAHKARTNRDSQDLVFGRTPPRLPSPPRSEPAPTKHGRQPVSSRSRRTRLATARPPTSSPPASTGSRSQPGPATATVARPGTATATPSRAVKSRPGSGSTCTSHRRHRSRLWRKTPERRNPPSPRGVRSTATGIRTAKSGSRSGPLRAAQPAFAGDSRIVDNAQDR